MANNKETNSSQSSDIDAEQSAENNSPILLFKKSENNFDVAAKKFYQKFSSYYFTSQKKSVREILADQTPKVLIFNSTDEKEFFTSLFGFHLKRKHPPNIQIKYSSIDIEIDDVKTSCHQVAVITVDGKRFESLDVLQEFLSDKVDSEEFHYRDDYLLEHPAVYQPAGVKNMPDKVCFTDVQQKNIYFGLFLDVNVKIYYDDSWIACCEYYDLDAGKTVYYFGNDCLTKLDDYIQKTELEREVECENNRIEVALHDLEKLAHVQPVDEDETKFVVVDNDLSIQLRELYLQNNLVPAANDIYSKDELLNLLQLYFVDRDTPAETDSVWTTVYKTAVPLALAAIQLTASAVVTYNNVNNSPVNKSDSEPKLESETNIALQTTPEPNVATYQQPSNIYSEENFAFETTTTNVQATTSETSNSNSKVGYSVAAACATVFVDVMTSQGKVTPATYIKALTSFFMTMSADVSADIVFDPLSLPPVAVNDNCGNKEIGTGGNCDLTANDNDDLGIKKVWIVYSSGGGSSVFNTNGMKFTMICNTAGTAELERISDSTVKITPDGACDGGAFEYKIHDTENLSGKGTATFVATNPAAPSATGDSCTAVVADGVATQNCNLLANDNGVGISIKDVSGTVIAVGNSANFGCTGGTYEITNIDGSSISIKGTCVAGNNLQTYKIEDVAGQQASTTFGMDFLAPPAPVANADTSCSTIAADGVASTTCNIVSNDTGSTIAIEKINGVVVAVSGSTSVACPTPAEGNTVVTNVDGQSVSITSQCVSGSPFTITYGIKDIASQTADSDFQVTTNVPTPVANADTSCATIVADGVASTTCNIVTNDTGVTIAIEKINGVVVAVSGSTSVACPTPAEGNTVVTNVDGQSVSITSQCASGAPLTISYGIKDVLSQTAAGTFQVATNVPTPTGVNDNCPSVVANAVATQTCDLTANDSGIGLYIYRIKTTNVNVGNKVIIPCPTPAEGTLEVTKISDSSISYRTSCISGSPVIEVVKVRDIVDQETTYNFNIPTTAPPKANDDNCGTSEIITGGICKLTDNDTTATGTKTLTKVNGQTFTTNGDEAAVNCASGSAVVERVSDTEVRVKPGATCTTPGSTFNYNFSDGIIESNGATVLFQGVDTTAPTISVKDCPFEVGIATDCNLTAGGTDNSGVVELYKVGGVDFTVLGATVTFICSEGQVKFDRKSSSVITITNTCGSGDSSYVLWDKTNTSPSETFTFTASDTIAPTVNTKTCTPTVGQTTTCDLSTNASDNSGTVKIKEVAGVSMTTGGDQTSIPCTGGGNVLVQWKSTTEVDLTPDSTCTQSTDSTYKMTDPTGNDSSDATLTISPFVPAPTTTADSCPSVVADGNEIKTCSLTGNDSGTGIFIREIHGSITNNGDTVNIPCTGGTLDVTRVSNSDISYKATCTEEKLLNKSYKIRDVINQESSSVFSILTTIPPPIANADNAGGKEVVVGGLLNLLSNDVSYTGTKKLYELNNVDFSTNGIKITVNCSGGGTSVVERVSDSVVRLTPDGFCLADSTFTYNIFDGTVKSNDATVTFKGVDLTAPTVNAKTCAPIVGQTSTCDLSTNASDNSGTVEINEVGGDALTTNSAQTTKTCVGGGTILIKRISTTTVELTPDNLCKQSTATTYIMSDPAGNKSSAATLTINPVITNSPPTFNDQTLGDFHEGQTGYSKKITVVDTDGDTFSCIKISGDSSVTVNDKTVSVDESSFTKTETITVKCEDDKGNANSAQVTVKFNNVFTMPAKQDSDAVRKNFVGSIYALDFTDKENDSLTCTVKSDPTGKIVMSGNKVQVKDLKNPSNPRGLQAATTFTVGCYDNPEKIGTEVTTEVAISIYSKPLTRTEGCDRKVYPISYDANNYSSKQSYNMSACTDGKNGHRFASELPLETDLKSLHLARSCTLQGNGNPNTKTDLVCKKTGAILICKADFFRDGNYYSEIGCDLHATNPENSKFSGSVLVENPLTGNLLNTPETDSTSDSRNSNTKTPAEAAKSLTIEQLLFYIIIVVVLVVALCVLVAFISSFIAAAIAYAGNMFANEEEKLEISNTIDEITLLENRLLTLEDFNFNQLTGSVSVLFELVAVSSGIKDYVEIHHSKFECPFKCPSKFVTDFFVLDCSEFGEFMALEHTQIVSTETRQFVNIKKGDVISWLDVGKYFNSFPDAKRSRDVLGKPNIGFRFKSGVTECNLTYIFNVIFCVDETINLQFKDEAKVLKAFSPLRIYQQQVFVTANNCKASAKIIFHTQGSDFVGIQQLFEVKEIKPKRVLVTAQNFERSILAFGKTAKITVSNVSRYDTFLVVQQQHEEDIILVPTKEFTVDDILTGKVYFLRKGKKIKPFNCVISNGRKSTACKIDLEKTYRRVIGADAQELQVDIHVVNVEEDVDKPILHTEDEEVEPLNWRKAAVLMNVADALKRSHFPGMANTQGAALNELNTDYAQGQMKATTIPGMVV